MSEPRALAALHSRYDELLKHVESADGAIETSARDSLRSDIVDLFRDTERTLAELAEFKEQIRHLVAKFKAIPTAPAARRVDHLGSSTYLDRGWSQMAAGEYAAAVETLHKARDLAPGDVAVELMLGWALMRAAEYDQALVLLQRVLAREPANLLARANLGFICLKKGIFGEAVEHLSRVLRTPTDRKATLYANFYMGLLYLEREMYGDAKTFLANALELGPNFTEAWWELGRACYLEGSTADASRAWRQGAVGGRFNVWGGRCVHALARLEEGQVVSFA